jgi:hypothetical protein
VRQRTLALTLAECERMIAGPASGQGLRLIALEPDRQSARRGALGIRLLRQLCFLEPLLQKEPHDLK